MLIFISDGIGGEGKQENPWDVSNIEEFLYYCCPECNIKCKNGQLFIEHATQSHEQAKTVSLYFATNTDLEDEEMLMSGNNIDPPDLSDEEDEESEQQNGGLHKLKSNKSN